MSGYADVDEPIALELQCSPVEVDASMWASISTRLLKRSAYQFGRRQGK